MKPSFSQSVCEKPFTFFPSPKTEYVNAVTTTLQSLDKFHKTGMMGSKLKKEGEQPMMNNRLYDTVNDPTAKRFENATEMKNLKNLSLEERMKALASMGVCSFNWAEKVMA